MQYPRLMGNCFSEGGVLNIQHLFVCIKTHMSSWSVMLQKQKFDGGPAAKLQPSLNLAWLCASSGLTFGSCIHFFFIKVELHNQGMTHDAEKKAVNVHNNRSGSKL